MEWFRAEPSADVTHTSGIWARSLEGRPQLGLSARAPTCGLSLWPELGSPGSKLGGSIWTAEQSGGHSAASNQPLRALASLWVRAVTACPDSGEGDMDPTSQCRRIWAILKPPLSCPSKTLIRTNFKLKKQSLIIGYVGQDGHQMPSFFSASLWESLVLCQLCVTTHRGSCEPS